MVRAFWSIMCGAAEIAAAALVAGCSARGDAPPSPTVAVLPATTYASNAGAPAGDDLEGTKCESTLAEITRKEPSPEAFDAILEAVESQACMKVRSQAIARAGRDIDIAAWPDEARRAPKSWDPFDPAGDPELWRLVRHVEATVKVTPEWIGRLEQPRLAALTSLSVTFETSGDEQAGDRGARAIAESRTFAGLRSLRITSSDLSDEGARAIARSTTLASLTSLALDQNYIGPDGARAIAESATLPRLTALLLGRNFVGAEGAKAIGGSPLLARLTRLDLDFNLIGAEGAAAICAPAAASRLAELSLRYNLLGDDGAKAIASSKSIISLKKLDLFANEIGDAGANALASGAALPKDASLDLTTNPIAEAAEAALKAAFPSIKLLRDPVQTRDMLQYDSDFSFPKPRGKEVQPSKVDPPRGLPRDVRYRRVMNGRFSFAVDFPTFLVPQEMPGNGDGRAFIWSKRVEMLAWGDNNMTMQSVADDYRDIMKEGGKGAVGALRGDSFTITFSAAGKTVHRKTIRKHGRNVSVQITHDEPMKPYFDSVARSVFDSIRILGAPM